MGHGYSHSRSCHPNGRDLPLVVSQAGDYIRGWLVLSLTLELTAFTLKTIMLGTSLKLQLALQCLAGAVHAQSAGSAARTTYGDNALAIDLDNEAISQNYQDVDIQLLAPAFINSESVPAGFSDGTSGPTPDHELGK